MNTVLSIQNLLQGMGDSSIALHSKRFFKTGVGEYAEGDQFIGIRVPVLRKHIRQFKADATIDDLQILLRSNVHEIRLFALLLMIEMYRAETAQNQQKIYKLYLANTAHVNNWDLVDISAPHILGAHLHQHKKDRQILRRLAKSECMWERRISIVATFFFIRKNEFLDTVELAEMLLNDTHDLIHKAVGWMLREVAKRDQLIVEEFLHKHSLSMPRTMLRYTIERFTDAKRQRYMAK